MKEHGPEHAGLTAFLRHSATRLELGRPVQVRRGTVLLVWALMFMIGLGAGLVLAASTPLSATIGTALVCAALWAGLK